MYRMDAQVSGWAPTEVAGKTRIHDSDFEYPCKTGTVWTSGLRSPLWSYLVPKAATLSAHQKHKSQIADGACHRYREGAKMWAWGNGGGKCCIVESTYFSELGS